MQPEQQSCPVTFSQRPLADQLDLLYTQRQQLLAQEQQCLARQRELEEQQQQWLSRRTIHELQCWLFWHKRSLAAAVKAEKEAQAPSA